MKVNDRVYGQINITEPVLLELIKSKPLQRLKEINQAGASKYVTVNKTVSRYEHSLGVMILLKILGASLEEQIAGLLHDVPHTAFSHVVDFVFTNNKYDHEFHEKFHAPIINNSDIPKILEKFAYKLDRILDEHNFLLLERELPDLCADRIDYALRDRVAMKYNSTQVPVYVKNFTVQNQEIIFKDREIAKAFAEDYLDMDYRSWSHPLEVACYQLLANALKLALEHNIITQDDLFQTDDVVYNKLKESKDKEVLDYLDKLNPKLKIIQDPDDYDFQARNKLRYVDPKFISRQGSIQHVTEAWPEFKEVIAKHKDWIEAGNYIKIINY